MTTEATYDEMSELWGLINPNPFKELAKVNGCNLDLGDKLVIPEDWLVKIPKLRRFKNTKGVEFQKDIENAFTVRL